MPYELISYDGKTIARRKFTELSTAQEEMQWDYKVHSTNKPDDNYAKQSNITDMQALLITKEPVTNINKIYNWHIFECPDNDDTFGGTTISSYNRDFSLTQISVPSYETSQYRVNLNREMTVKDFLVEVIKNPVDYGAIYIRRNIPKSNPIKLAECKDGQIIIYAHKKYDAVFEKKIADSVQAQGGLSLMNYYIEIIE